MKNTSIINNITAKTLVLGISILVISYGKHEKIIVKNSFTESNEDKSIAIPELRKHLFSLASDSMNGRATGSKEYLLAANYCVEQLRKAGIQTLLKDSANNPTFYQDVQYSDITVSGGNYLHVNAYGLEYQFPNSLKFKVKELGSFGTDKNPLQVVFVGYGISAPEYGWDDFKGLSIEGKAVIVMKGEPMRDGGPVIPRSINRQKLMDYRSNIIERKAAAIIEIADIGEVEKWFKVKDKMKDQLIYKRKSTIGELIVRPDVVKALFKGQAYNPTLKETKTKNKYKTFELSGVSISLDCKFNEKNRYISPNIVGIIKSKDTRLSNQYVVVGAHLDHIGTGFNGADDNASGCAGLLEIAKALAVNPPKRSILLVLFSGEEKGLLGSRYFVENSPIPTDSIIAMINLDMIGRTAPENKKDRAHYICNLEWTSDYMLRYVEDVNAKTYQWPLKRMISAGSDHSSFAKKGIPSVFFFSGWHTDVHKATDDPENIDYEKMQVITQLAYEVAKLLADEGIIEELKPKE